MKSIAVIIAFKGFRDEEFIIPYNVFIEKNIQVDVFSSAIGTAVGKLGLTFEVKNLVENLSVEKYDVLLLVGGPGGYDYLGSPVIKNIILSAEENKKIIAAICMAPKLLAEAGVLSGKTVTSFSGVRDDIISIGANHTSGKLEIDGRYITADGPSSAKIFAEAIVNKINE